MPLNDKPEILLAVKKLICALEEAFVTWIVKTFTTYRPFWPRARATFKNLVLPKLKQGIKEWLVPGLAMASSEAVTVLSL